MDITSYLLGKKKGGFDWSEIGYDEAPISLIDTLEYSKRIKNNWNSSTTSLSYKFSNDTLLVFMPAVDTSNSTTFKYMFNSCTCLLEIPQLDTSKGTDFSYFFNLCDKIISIGMLDMSSCTTIYTFFSTNNNPKNLKYLGGFKDLGKSFSTTKKANSTDYSVYLVFATKLTHESLMNVINNLYDISSIGCNTQGLQLGSTNLAKLTAEEIAIATNKGWTVS